MVIAHFSCQRDTIWNHLDGGLSEELFRLVWPVDVSVRDFLGLVNWSGKSILNVSIMVSWVGPWTTGEGRRGAECRQTCFFSAPDRMCCDPVTQAPATEDYELNPFSHTVFLSGHFIIARGQ